MKQIKDQLDHINQRISQALAESKRPDNDKVRLLAVSKKHSFEKIQALYELGQRDFGESYVQEAIQKIRQSHLTDIIWHFIGPIQSNKTQDIAANFDWVHSVDRLKIARRLSQQRPDNLAPLKICLQINISDEAQKSGFSVTEIQALLPDILQLPNLSLQGLMAIPKNEPDVQLQRKPFQQLRQLMQQLNEQYSLNMQTLSMGMSNDLEAAILEGATIVRIGTALFGPRET
jgi:pyridoxal phosphate enzyme (YggS family)